MDTLVCSLDLKYDLTIINTEKYLSAEQLDIYYKKEKFLKQFLHMDTNLDSL